MKRFTFSEGKLADCYLLALSHSCGSFTGPKQTQSTCRFRNNRKFSLFFDPNRPAFFEPVLVELTDSIEDLDAVIIRRRDTETDHFRRGRTGLARNSATVDDFHANYRDYFAPAKIENSRP